MQYDDNIRSLAQVMILAKEIINAGKEKEFMEAMQGKENLFVVGTAASQKFIAEFMDTHSINPLGKTMHNLSYGRKRCTRQPLNP